jgi:hypothetical protein
VNAGGPEGEADPAPHVYVSLVWHIIMIPRQPVFVASLLEATLYQGNPGRNHKLW